MEMVSISSSLPVLLSMWKQDDLATERATTIDTCLVVRVGPQVEAAKGLCVVSSGDNSR